MTLAKFMTAVYPGTFDPMTLGHEDLMRRASRLFDKLILAVAAGYHKRTMFTIAERLDIAREMALPNGNVEVVALRGLLSDFVLQHKGSVVVRGLRAVSDFDYELQMAQMNYRLAGVETLFISTNPLYSFLSSSLVKDVATYGGDITGLLPDTVRMQLIDRLNERNQQWLSSLSYKIGDTVLGVKITDIVRNPNSSASYCLEDGGEIHENSIEDFMEMDLPAYVQKVTFNHYGGISYFYNNTWNEDLDDFTDSF